MRCSGGWPGTQLSRVARSALADIHTHVFVSAATGWEITTKHRLGKLPCVAAVIDDLGSCIASLGFHDLPITFPDAERAGRLPGPHRDPFDRMIVAQALGADLLLVSNEALFDPYGVRRLW